MSAWETHVRETRARTWGHLGAVYKKSDSVYNNSIMTSQFRPGQGVFQCRVCTRETRDVGDNGSVELCHECYEVAGAENTLSDAGDSMTAEERASIQAYIWQMNRAAVAKGGTLPASELGPTPDEGTTEEGQPMERAQLKRNRPRPTARKKSERPRGRPPVAEEDRLLPITMRLKADQIEKLQALGRDWLGKAINRAKLPE